MFSVIISEKGGAERREAFDRTEINVGRVQGNDLMLPKGNVSKRHARLLFRDGRFIVTDLKSTNGTYVNGRKIAQATIVREGDKIYIGDFVLRIESGAGAGASPVSPSQPAPPLDEMPSDLQSAPPGPIEEDAPAPRPMAPPAQPSRPAVAPRTAVPAPAAPAVVPVAAIPAPPPIPKQIAAPLPPPMPVPALPLVVASDAAAGETPKPTGTLPPGLRASAPPMEPPSSSQPSSVPEKAIRAPAPRIEPKTGDRHEVISHFPLEHDPDESMHFAVPAPPRVPSSPKPFGKTSPSAQAAPPRGAAVQPAAPGTPFTVGEAPKPGAPAGPAEAPRPPAQPSEAPRSPAQAFAAPQGGPPSAPTLPVATGHDVAPRPIPARVPVPTPPGGAPAVERATSPSVGLAALGIVPEAGGRPPPARRSTVDGGRSYELEARARSAGPTDGGTAERFQAVVPPRAPERSPAELARVAAQRAALAALVERTGELVDLAPLAGGAPPDEALSSRIERALADASGSLRDRGDVDLDALLVEARRELCELGPLTQLVQDEDVTEIQVIRHDHVVALHGDRPVPSDVAFSSEAAVGRAVRRLCLQSGQPLAPGEIFVERRLHDGGLAGRLFAVLPRAGDGGHMVVVRKPQRADLSLEDLVRSGTISRAIASLLSQCVAARANILVTGAAGAGATTLIGALAGAGSTEDRVVVLQEDDELVFNQPHTVSILLGDNPEERARAVQAAARVHPDRLVVGAFAGAAAAEMVDAMGSGVDGVLAAAKAPTLRQAVLRLTADIAATRPGLSPEVAREWLASVFDLAIEVARLRDGRHRVLRVGELAVDGNRVAIRDIFTFAVERTAAGGTLEGTFSPTGVVPGIVDDLAARGIPVDPSIFRRHS